MAKVLEKFKSMDEEQLSYELIEAQYALRNTRGEKNAKSLVILVSGIEMAGKGEAVKQLREWVDPRYLKVKADRPSILGNDVTFWQPYARYIPAEGQILVVFGNWYSDLLRTAMHVTQPIDEARFEYYVQSMQAFEQDLRNNHVDVIKVWFDLSWKALQNRLKTSDASEVQWHKENGLSWRNKAQYESLQQLRQRFTADWCVIDGEDETVRDQTFAQYVLQTLKNCPVHQQKSKQRWSVATIPDSILTIENSDDPKNYKKQLKKMTYQVAQALRKDSRHVVVVFEGMDAAGKGGAIKRIVHKLDPREYAIHTIGSPEKYELRRPYLWRFWTKLQNEDEICIFDRSWYGRVLVERVEGFASELEWQRAYDEINRFEADLTEANTVVIKFWLAISKDEQALRFKAREETPHKRFKITEEDWRNRARWDDYLQAAADMFTHTNTAYAPWQIIATNNKKAARLQVLEAILKQLSA